MDRSGCRHSKLRERGGEGQELRRGLYDGAGVLIETKRNPALAAKCWRTILRARRKTEEAPAFIAHIRLGRLKQQLGDAAGAQQEFAAAPAMAHELIRHRIPDIDARSESE